MWVPTTGLPTTVSHPFYRRPNQLSREHGFDDFVEDQCADFYAETTGRPSLPPGIYFRLLLIGCFEGIDSERGIAWRAADSSRQIDFVLRRIDLVRGRIDLVTGRIDFAPRRLVSWPGESKRIRGES